MTDGERWLPNPPSAPLPAYPRSCGQPRADACTQHSREHDTQPPSVGALALQRQGLRGACPSRCRWKRSFRSAMASSRVARHGGGLKERMKKQAEKKPSGGGLFCLVRHPPIARLELAPEVPSFMRGFGRNPRQIPVCVASAPTVVPRSRGSKFPTAHPAAGTGPERGGISEGSQ